jgi:hypothetical protein
MIACATPTVSQAKSEVVKSVVGAISSASGQARVALVKGNYRTTSGRAEFVFEVPSDMGSTLKFNYQNSAFVSASWDFQKDIFIQIRVGGKCARLRVSRLEYGEGGFLGGDSEQTIVSSGACRESEPLARLDDFLRLSPTSGDFFSGTTFVSQSSLKKCGNQDCTIFVSGSPIRRADFYNSSGADGQPIPGLSVAFKAQANIVLPGSGFLILGAQSAAIFDGLTYDLESNDGSAMLSHFNVTLSDGLLSSGQTILRFRPGTVMSANGFRVHKDGVDLTIDGGSLSGQLGEGSSILLTQHGTQTSILNIRSAEVNLINLHFAGSGADTSLAIDRGVFSTRLEKSELWFSDKNSVRLGYLGLNLILGCPPEAQDECIPVKWDKAGVSVVGVINGFDAALQGGQFNISSVGQVQLKSGQIVADTLRIDTRDSVTPITGKINRFEVVLEGQDISVDDKTGIRVAQAEVKAYDLIYEQGESLPIGSASFAGVASGIEGGQVGKVRFDAGAKFELRVERRKGGEPEIAEGRLEGDAKVVMSEGNSADVKVVVDGLRYYRGYGEADLTLTGNRASYAFSTPSDHETKDKFPLKAEIDVKSITLVPELAQPLKIGPTRVKASHKEWKIEPILGVPYKLKVPVQGQELVYATIKTSVGGTVCAPKVNLQQQMPYITGKIDIFASDSGGHLKIYDNALSEGIRASADDRGCNDIGTMVCFLIGSAFGGVIGGAGMAVLCNDSMEEAEQRLGDKIRDESVRKVSESVFQFDY